MAMDCYLELRGIGHIGRIDAPDSSRQRPSEICCVVVAHARTRTHLKDKNFCFLRKRFECQLDFTVGDDGFSNSIAKAPRAKTVKTALGNTHNFHVAALGALLELGQTALSLGELDSAIEAFQRRLR